jgi:predicted HTH transcriptional regulator
MEEQEVSQLLRAGEQRAVEFKRGGPLNDSNLVARIARAVLAMSNKRDGGRVFVGVENDGTPGGIGPADFATWNHDHLRDKIAVYADPYVAFDVENLDFKGASIIVLHVMEFEDVPVICKKAFEQILRDGTIYVRGRRKPESVPIMSHSDMRELMDLAAEKAVARFSRLRQAATTPVDANLFDKELGDFWPSR